MAVINLIGKGLTKIFGSRNERLVKGYRRRVEQINALEPRVRPLTDGELRQRAQALRQQVAEGASPATVMYEAFAIMREALDRHVGIRNIFNPALRERFDVSKLPTDARAAYDQVAAEIERTAPLPMPGSGSGELLPGWLQVEIPPRLYEAVREMYPESKPPFRTRPFDVQLIGGMVLHEGKIAEMKTGEGKTIVAPLACFMACIEGLQCHVVTVNDYLVQRDRDWVLPAFHMLGFRVGAIHPYHMQHPDDKKLAYRCDIVYGTNSEFGFDYLRDNMKLSVEDQVQRRRQFCIIDEVDSILIDEARTPLIISGPARDDAPQYIKANEVAERLVAIQRQANAQTAQRIRQAGFAAQRAQVFRVAEAAVEKVISKFRDLGPDFLDEKEGDLIEHTQYYVVKREQKQAAMTHLGVEEAQKIVGARFYVVGNDMGWDHLINNALRAHAVYEIDREYVVENGEVIIVDEFTGRKMIGRQWSDGLHQAVEAKEVKRGVKIKQETQTLATITIQNFFKLYGRLAGMTGTAMTEATEFLEIYDLDVVTIPTNKPVIRDDAEDLIFLTQQAKWNAIIEEIHQMSESGRPVLVGTTSVEKSEVLSAALMKRHGIEHEVLNAKQHEREAHIVAKAGQQHQDRQGRMVGNVTIATNMAGRGTDIKLTPQTLAAGGLHIVGTERHEARRIDNQLRGRAGRQGDPGSSRFFISMEDDLMKLFAGKSTMRALSLMGMKEDDAIEHRWITKSVERAQRKVEERNYEIRKNLLEYDEVMEYQRNGFYGTRQQVLEGRRIKELIFEYIAEAIEDAVERFVNDDLVPQQVAEAAKAIVGASVDPGKLRGDSVADVEHAIRSDAKADVRQEIEINVGEFMNDDLDPQEWDLKGLSRWAMSRFNVDIKQSTLRESTPTDVVNMLCETAHELIDRRPLDALEKFYAPDYTAQQLADWAKQKFGLDLETAELQRHKNERQADAQARIAQYIYERADQAYLRREIMYPVEFAIETTMGAMRLGSSDATAWALDQLVKWANHRYALGWTMETLNGKTVDEVMRMLTEAAEQWRGPKLRQWLDETLKDDPGESALMERVRERWAVRLNEELLAEPDRRAMLETVAIGVLRAELTQLERYVLLQILDQTWKDHLYAMDQLKDSIGLRGYAEQDPKIAYKREGARMFRQMLASVRDQVTDLVFRARLTADFSMPSAYRDTQESFDVDESTGVDAVAKKPVQATAQQKADLEAAERAGAESHVTATIVNKAPKVGRNDPCPCGSGKKYKKCCGQNA